MFRRKHGLNYSNQTPAQNAANLLIRTNLFVSILEAISVPFVVGKSSYTANVCQEAPAYL